MKKKQTKKNTESNAYVHDFSVDYKAFNISDITNIDKHLMTKHNVK